MSGRMTKQEKTTVAKDTYDFLAFLDTSLDFGHVPLSFIVDFLDLIFSKNLQSLSGG